MESRKEKLQKILRLSLLAFLIIVFIFIFLPFTVPILLAGFVALGSEPIIRKIQFKSKKRKLFSIGLTLLMFIIFVVPLVFFVLRIATDMKTMTSETMQNSQFLQAFFGLWEKIQSSISATMAEMGLDMHVFPGKDELISKVSPVFLNKATLFLAALPDLALSLFVFFCMLFVFIINADSLKKFLMKAEILPSEEIDFIIKTLQSNCCMILISTVLIGALHALIVATGSAIFGYHEFFLIFTLTFFLSFIPVIGATPVAILLALISFLLGHTGQGIGLLVVSAVTGSIDNVLKPFIFSNSEGNLHPVLSLLGIIGAILTFGLPGLLLGPLILQATTTLVPQLMRRAFNTPPES